MTAPAERGKANAAVEMTIAEALGVSKECARVIRGKTAPRKVVEIVGLSESEVYRRLSLGAGEPGTSADRRRRGVSGVW